VENSLNFAAALRKAGAGWEFGTMDDGLSPLDYLLHRGEAYPATRSAFLNLEILDGTADWGRLRDALDPRHTAQALTA